MKKISIISLFIVLLVTVVACDQIPVTKKELPKFSSCGAIKESFERVQQDTSIRTLKAGVAAPEMAMEAAVAAGDTASRDFSETNIQVEGVDEADMVKTDGNYIYALSNNKLFIAKAYPADNAEILSETEIKNFYPNEIFIHKNRLLLFGRTEYNFESEVGEPVEPGMPINKRMIMPDIMPRYMSYTSARLYDITDKEDIELIKTLDFEGDYLTSRKIDSDVYFVVNSYPNFYGPEPLVDDIVPLYRESKTDKKPEKEDFEPIAKCADISYIPPMHATNFITVVGMSMTEDNDINKEVIVGSGQNVYASLENFYVAQTSYNYPSIMGESGKQTTAISKFNLDNGNIEFTAKGEVPGHILNQFSMDEFNNNFRIATTLGQVWRGQSDSTNNVYVLDESMKTVGKLEDLAPGESIYSVRFMGEKGYVVTFKKVDPLFVIDLSNPTNPLVLGKLKIPGYSDYLHPYDENHLIGVGKEAVEAEEGDFAWYQGMKMAIFDVSDVENPKELHKVVIGDRGTDSYALHDHKAFLFDREKNLLVIPVLLAEIKGEKTHDNQYGDFVFQGAYVYDLTLDDGFELKGRISHYDNDEAFKKSGYYFSGDYSIKRSLYIEDVLYTLSDKRLQLNDLDDLERLKILEFD